MKRNHIKIVGSSALVMCMTLVMLLSVFRTEASVTKEVKYIEGISYTKDNTIPEITDEDLKSELDGYLFAGWYTKSDEGTTYDPVSNPTLNGTYYAKYVPEEVLDIKAQISGTLLNTDTTDDAKSSIRFVTSIDSTDYKQISFNIKRPNKEYDAEATKYVYKELYAVDATKADDDNLLKTYKPSEFHATSQFFKTWTISNVPDTAYDTDITVTPYWVTLDGTRVEGTKSIKSVNLGRSWVYIDTTANADTEQYGTKDHPFTTLDAALNTVKRENGKIIVKGTSTFEVPSTFKWNPDKTKVNGKVRNITVTGENGTSSFISFDTVGDIHFNDNVTFENVKLHFATHVYANGNQFTIADSVVLNNTDTNLYGGASKISVESTYLEVHAGTWTGIYGGGRYTGGDVSNDTNIHITKAKVFSNTADTSMVVGGGRGSNTVGGNTNVTVGEGFNSGVTIVDGHYSAIYGGGKDSGSVVEGNTNITIKDGAKVNFVYGGGASNTTVKGNCNVTLAGGEVYSIWGGARGENPSSAGTNEKDTVVKVTGGTVAQIIGGNGTGMTGDTYVEVTGGKVTRRIHGGCYNDILSLTPTSYHVTGYATVVIKDKDAVASLSGGDAGITAGSRCYEEHTDEIGILICNNDSYESLKNNISTNYNEYDYLVKATSGGDVTTKTGVIEGEVMLSIIPDALVTPGTVTDFNNNSVTYFKGAGVCELPERESLATQCTVEVDFNSSYAQSAIDNCEARIDGIYYDTFVNAVNSAKTRNTKPTVTVMKDCTVNTTIENVAGEEYTIVGDGNTKKVITVNSAVSELFKVKGKLKLDNLKFTGGQHIVYNDAGTLTLDNIEMSNIAGVGIYHKNGTTYAYNTNISNAAKFGIYVLGGTANIDDVNVSGINSTSDHDAIKITAGTLNIKNEGVTISNVEKNNGINVAGGTVNADAVTITDIKNGHGIYVSKGRVEIKQANVGSEDGAIKKSALYMTGNNQAEAIISNFTASNIEAQVVYLVGNTSAEISNFNLTSSKDTGVRTKETATVILEDGTLTAANGRYGIYADGTSTVTATDVSIVRNVAMPSGVDSLVYVGTGSTITLKEDDGTSMIQGNSELAGRGVEVEGTFNLNGGTISNHTLSSGNGAGVLVKAGGAFNMNGGSVSNNTAPNGGGVSVEGTPATEATEAVLATFNLSGGSISSNTATTNGGGVAVLASGDFTMTGGTIGGEGVNNTATNGGGVSVENTTFNLDAGTISYNTATDGGGVYLSANASLIMDGGDIKANTVGTNSSGSRGGGVCLNASTASFTLNNGNIDGNTARAGGGVIVRSGNFSMNGGAIKGNNVGTGSNGNGGALWLAAGYNFTMNGGSITGNTASNKGGALYVNAKSTITLNKGEISGNTATNDSTGHSIHSDSTSNISTVIIEQGFIILTDEIHTKNSKGVATLTVTDKRTQ